jgi:hypothetical protein
MDKDHIPVQNRLMKEHASTSVVFQSLSHLTRFLRTTTCNKNGSFVRTFSARNLIVTFPAPYADSCWNNSRTAPESIGRRDGSM